jgi:hypothetical protein
VIADRARRWLLQVAPHRRTVRRDFVAGLPGAISGVPDGMAASVLAGVNPVYGLYASILGPIGGGLTASSGAASAESASAARPRTSPCCANSASTTGNGWTRRSSRTPSWRSPHCSSAIITSPAAGETLNGNQVHLTWTQPDPELVDSYELSVNGSLISPGPAPTDREWALTLPEGIDSINLWAVNTNGREIVSRVFFIDTQP